MRSWPNANKMPGEKAHNHLEPMQFPAASVSIYIINRSTHIPDLDCLAHPNARDRLSEAALTLVSTKQQ